LHETRTRPLSPLRGLLPPLAGALPKGAMKMARQVGLVGEPGRQCDLGQGPPVTLRGDHLPGVPQPALEQVLMGRVAHRRPKYLHKMVGAQTGDPGPPPSSSRVQRTVGQRNELPAPGAGRLPRRWNGGKRRSVLVIDWDVFSWGKLGLREGTLSSCIAPIQYVCISYKIAPIPMG